MNLSRVFDRWSWRRHLPWLLLVMFSMSLHLWQLEDRTFHHDEAIHAHSAFNLVNSGIYRYDPTYHGPLLYYLTAASFVIGGDSDFTARLPIAVAGILLIAVAWSLRRPLGGRAAWWTALLVTISPITLYYGRFLRMDILELLTASAALVAAWRAVHCRSSAWVWVGIWTALAFATKENAFVTAALLGGVVLLMGLGAGPRRAVAEVFAWIRRHRWGIMTAVATAVVVSVPLYTVGFRYPGDWFFPYKAIAYWHEQHTIQRVAGPPWYHLPRLGLYEFLPIFAALTWVVRRGRRMVRLEWALLLFALVSVAMYCYLGEKVPWLGVHQVWAFLPLAGMQLARTFGPNGVWWSRTLAAGGLCATMLVSIIATFIYDEITPSRRRVEALIYVQTSPEVLEPVMEGYRLAADGTDPVAAVGGEASWPLSWYWRNTPTWWSQPNSGIRPPLVLCDPGKEVEVRSKLGPGYSSERIPLRSWWLMESRRPRFAEVFRYVFTREPWGDIGSTDTIVLRDTGEPPRAPRETGVPETLGEALGVDSAKVVGEGWLMEPRGVAVAPDGVLAVADAGLSTVVFFDADGVHLEISVPEELNQPEAVAWIANGVLLVADTWNHRILVYNMNSDKARILPEPEGGWYGPRAVAVAPDNTLAVADTGNKRIVLMTLSSGVPQLKTIGSEGAGLGQLQEPVGLFWLDNQRILACDTGNHRLQIFDRSGRSLQAVELPDVWSDYYSRPQVTVLGGSQWLVSDTPAHALWLVEGRRVRRIGLENAGIVPSGLAFSGSTLVVADTSSRVWIFEGVDE